MLSLTKRTVNNLSQIPPNVQEALFELGWTDRESVPKIVGSGDEAVVWNLPKHGFTVRIPHADTDDEKRQQEVFRQMSFFFAMIGGNMLGKLPSFIRVPYLWNDPSIQSRLPSGTLVMKTVFGRSLYFHGMRLFMHRHKGIDLMQYPYDSMTDLEIVEAFPHLGLERIRYSSSEVLIKELFGSEVLEKFLFTISYLSRYGLSHNDLHPGNIMIEFDKQSGTYFIYMIDFGKSTIGYKGHDLIQKGRQLYMDPTTFPLIWNDSGIKIKH